MDAGNCTLCREPRPRRDSHLIAAGFHTIIREAIPGDRQVVMMQGASFQSDVQARAHVLCDICEQRFNQRGEDWVIEHAYRSPNQFPLRAKLERLGAVQSDQRLRTFKLTADCGVDGERLAYFALSVFWRAAAAEWRLGKAKLPKLPLGPYTDALREFLLDQAGIPANLALLTTLSASDHPMHNLMLKVPSPSNRAPEFRGFEFIVPGITFKLFVGALPKLLYEVCTVRSSFVCAGTFRDEHQLESALNLVRQAPRRGKWAR